MHARACRHLPVVLAIVCGSLAAAQQLPPTPVFRSGVDAIEIEMRVVDRDGRPVTDLEESEIQVLEDGRPQTIIAFSRVSVPSAADRTGVSPSTRLPAPDVASNRIVGSGRIYLLVLDDLHVDSRNTERLKAAARRFVEGFVAPGDLVSVVYTGVRPDAAQDFTSDRRLLLAAIDKFIGRKLPPATVERMEQYNTLFRARGRPRFEDLRDRQDAERASNARAAMASIEAASGVLARVTGRRKAAILFSEGLDYDLSGLRSRGRLPGAADGPTVLPTTAPTGGSEADAVGRPDVHSYTHDVLLSLQAAMGAASRANVTMYSVDVQGSTSDMLADLGAPVDDPSLGLTTQHVNAEMRDAQETLTVIAANTGGFAALSPSGYDTAFGRIVRESSEYYLLAYSPWNPAPDGKFRDISVRVTRPGVRVSARRGYYAPRQPVKRGFRFVAPGVSDETSSLVMAPLPASGLSLDLHALALKGEAGKAEVVVTAMVDGRQLAGHSGDTEVTNTLELALMAIDSAGRVQGATGRVIDVRLDPVASRIVRDTGYRVVSRLQVPAGRYQIRQAVRERNGSRAGSVFADLDVPDFTNRLSISNVALTSTAVNVVPTSVDADTYQRLAVLPSVRRTFAPGDQLIAAADIYDGRRARDLEVTTTLVDSRFQEYYRHVTRVAARDLKSANGEYRHAVQISLPRADGDLMLIIAAAPAASPQDQVSRSVSLAVTGPAE